MGHLTPHHVVHAVRLVHHDHAGPRTGPSGTASTARSARLPPSVVGEFDVDHGAALHIVETTEPGTKPSNAPTFAKPSRS